MGVVYMGAWRAAALLNVLKAFTGPYPFLCKIHSRFLILSVVGYSVTSSPIHSVQKLKTVLKGSCATVMLSGSCYFIRGEIDCVLYFHAVYDIRPF